MSASPPLPDNTSTHVTRVHEKNEPAFAAFANQLHLQKRQMNGAAPVVFGIAMTAVAEWYQRAFNEPSFDRLMAEMATLARLTPSTLTAGSPIEFTIAANGGSWLCLKCKEPATGNEFLEVRQFVASEDDYSNDDYHHTLR